MRPQMDFEYGKFTCRARLTEAAIRLALCLIMCLVLAALAQAQTETTGSFHGSVSNKSGAPVPGATIEIKNVESGVQRSSISDKDGNFVESLLGPGDYEITISAKGYNPKTVRETIYATQPNKVIPLPVTLDPETVAEATPAPTPTGLPQPTVTPTPKPPPPPPPRGEPLNTTDARRNGAFTNDQVETLPLGGTTLTRSFDELALLLPGVAQPPETQGSVAGPGVGPGVGSAGQFAVNGMRSRSNNFTVDGSDNNDEDIGVRRQGFFALVPQPIESIKEFQITTLLAPAQYGRNVGAQVNAISKSGGNEYHGAIYGFFNSSQLNAANFFDNTSGNTTIPLQGRVLNLNDGTLGAPRNVFIDGKQKFVTNDAGKQDSFTLGQGGLVFGGPLVPNEPTKSGRSLFFFISAEGQLLNATKEESFAVPTVAQRGLFNSGATGLCAEGDCINNPVFPTRVMGDAIFSLFPFPNNPNGIYGENTFTQVLPNSAQSKILSGKVDGNFKALGKPQDFVARYNFTNDWRDVPVTGGAIFSRLRPRVRTQNFSTFLNTPHLTSTMSNQLRLSYGRTRLIFDEGRDPSLIPSEQTPNTPFLLNRPRLENATLPTASGINLCPTPNNPIPNSVCYFTVGTTERGDSGDIGTGPLGQLIISGFSPVGVDVFNFPQRRVNNTYQAADTMSLNRGRNNFAFGADVRRTELDSDLPRNARPLAIFGATPQLPGAIFLRPTDLAAAGAPSGFFQTLSRFGGDSTIHLRYYQLNFFGQDEVRLRQNLSLSFGVRYEYNTVPHETANRIESTFSAPELSLLPDLQTFVAGRSQIFEPDRNNVAPRIGIAYSRNSGAGRQTVIRAGYGLYYDQILGAVISQSRNVYPTYLTLNTAGGVINNVGVRVFDLFNQTFSISNSNCARLNGICYVVPGTLNSLMAPLSTVVTFNRDNRAFGGFALTLPERNLQTPMAHQYSVTVEEQISKSLVLSAAYVGTLGRSLLRNSRTLVPMSS